MLNNRNNSNNSNNRKDRNDRNDRINTYEKVVVRWLFRQESWQE